MHHKMKQSKTNQKNKTKQKQKTRKEKKGKQMKSQIIKVTMARNVIFNCSVMIKT